MKLDDELCLCFHVTKRKVLNYLRIERPAAASQLADCQGAGTGCGWCRKTLEQLHQASRAGNAERADLPAAADYAQQRANYVRDGGGTPPPGAAPIA